MTTLNLVFAMKLEELDSQVLNQKELNFWYHQLSHLQKQLLFYQERPTRKQVLEAKIEQAKDKINELEVYLGKSKDPHKELHDLISAYLLLYQVSLPSIARTLYIDELVIEKYLEKGLVLNENVPFVVWAIQTFQLDLNRYGDLLFQRSI